MPHAALASPAALQAEQHCVAHTPAQPYNAELCSYSGGLNHVKVRNAAPHSAALTDTVLPFVRRWTLGLEQRACWSRCSWRALLSPHPRTSCSLPARRRARSSAGVQSCSSAASC